MPNKMLLSTTLDAAMREEDSEMIYKLLKDFLSIEKEPHPRQLKTLASLKHIPDHLYMVLKRDFNVDGAVGLKHRQFEKPTFRKNADGEIKHPQTGTYNRNRLKK